MERRWSVREPVRFEASLATQERQELVAQATDISLGGVYLEIGELRPAIGTLVDLQLNVASKHLITLRFKAKVVREDKQGIGLAFRELDAVTFHALREMLNLRQSVPWAGQATAS